MQKACRKKLLRFIIHMTFAVVSSFPICKCVGLEEYIKIEMVLLFLSADFWNFSTGLKACAK